MELDSRFADIRQDVNHFDIWVRLSSIGNKVIISLPSQKHIHFNSFLKNGWTVKKSIRLRINENGCFIDIFLEKNAPPLRRTGKQKTVDIGYKKLIAGSDGEFAGANPFF